MRRVDAKSKTIFGVVFCLTLMSYSAVSQAQSLFTQLYGRNSGEHADRAELYQQGEDASYLASQTLWEIQRVRSLAATYGLEAALAEDQTMKPGDIISTPKGLMVFVVSRKANGDRVGNLVPLGASTLRTQSRLQAIDKQIRRDRRPSD